MASDNLLEYKPKAVRHPGDTVVEYLEHNGWSQRELARRTGLTTKTISEICNGKAPITPNTALALETVLRRPAHFWLNLQRRFDEMQARSQVAAKFDEWNEWAERFPVRVLKRYGWLDVGAHRSEVGALLSFLGVSSPDSWTSVWQASNVAYRQTRKLRTTQESISAWVRATELLGDQVKVEDFDERRLKSSLDQIRHLTRVSIEQAIPEMQALCASAGVAAVIVPELPHTGISGCARVPGDKKAIIGLTFRYRFDDQFWFTFFHEVAHILLHRKQHLFILDNAAEYLTDNVVDPDMRRNEEEANRFAADTLIPPRALSVFIQKNDLSNDAIHQFAEEEGIGPGIVVGRLQHDGLLAYHQGNKLKQRVTGHMS